MNELFLEFRLNGVVIKIKREEDVLIFEAYKKGDPISLDVIELVKHQMYKFNIFNNTCIVGFDDDDNICLHIIKENKKEYIYYSLPEDDKNMYTLKEIKNIYKYRCEAKIQEITDNFETLVKDISELHLFKNILFNKTKNKLYKELDTIMSIYRIELYKAQYIQDIKEANNIIIEEVKKLEQKLIKELKQTVLNKKKIS